MGYVVFSVAAVKQMRVCCIQWSCCQTNGGMLYSVMLLSNKWGYVVFSEAAV